MSTFSTLLAGLGLDWWARLGESSGTTMADSSGNSRSGSYAGAVTLGAAGLVDGDADTAVSFPGDATAYGLVPYGSWLNGRSSLSVGVIFKTTSTGLQYLIQRWTDSGSSGQVFGMDLSASDVVRVYVRTGGNRILSATVTGLRDGNRHLLALDWDGSTLRMYVDGAEVTTMSATGSLQAPTNTDVYLARRNPSTTTSPFTGTLDEAWIGPGLTATQHANIWAAVGTPAAPTTTWLWSGAATASGFTVAAKVSAAGASCRLAVAAGSTLTSPSYGSAVTADSDGYVKLTVTGLAASTAYTYGLELGGTLDTATVGHATTLPAAGAAASFSWGHASCAANGSNHRVFDSIASKSLAMFAYTGDLHYADITTNTPASFQSAYNTVHGSARRVALHQTMPVDYVWDDHDFGGDNSASSATAKPAAQSAYRQVVPHYPLPVSDAIYHWYMIGRVAFIVTDLRSYRDADGATDTSSKTMLGATQKAWFKTTLLDARAAGAQLIVWVSSSVWNTTGLSGVNYDNDTWAAFTYERTELADYIRDNGLAGNLVMVVGDAHMLAYDDGSHSDFATGGGAPLPQFCAAALDRTGLVRGTGWSSGTHAGGGQYGVLDFTDDGETLAWTWTGIQVDASTGADTVIYTASGTAAALGAIGP
ncbi:MAG: alkaline phosphatase D family protein, partial [Gordonia sp. (in: high G+C Gram-positive bacteria)]